MADPALSEVRRALARLRRAVARAGVELEGVAGALRHAEGRDFPTGEFDETAAHLRAVESFVEEQAERLEDKILHAGGLEPGRVRRRGTGGAA